MDHPYVELVYASVVGPTATLVARRLHWMLSERPGGFDVNVAELGASVGVGNSAGKNSPISRALGRLESFGFARTTPDRTGFVVFDSVPGLSERQRRRAPASVVAFHEALHAAHVASIAGRHDRRSAGPVVGAGGVVAGAEPSARAAADVGRRLALRSAARREGLGR